MIAVGAGFVRKAYHALHTEAEACTIVLKCARQLGMEGVILETDASNLTLAI